MVLPGFSYPHQRNRRYITHHKHAASCSVLARRARAAFVPCSSIASPSSFVLVDHHMAAPKSDPLSRLRVSPRMNITVTVPGASGARADRIVLATGAQTLSPNRRHAAGPQLQLDERTSRTSASRSREGLVAPAHNRRQATEAAAANGAPYRRYINHQLAVKLLDPSAISSAAGAAQVPIRERCQHFPSVSATSTSASGSIAAVAPHAAATGTGAIAPTPTPSASHLNHLRQRGVPVACTSTATVDFANDSMKDVDAARGKYAFRARALGMPRAAIRPASGGASGRPKTTTAGTLTSALSTGSLPNARSPSTACCGSQEAIGGAAGAAGGRRRRPMPEGALVVVPREPTAIAPPPAPGVATSSFPPSPTKQRLSPLSPEQRRSVTAPPSTPRASPDKHQVQATTSPSPPHQQREAATSGSPSWARSSMATNEPYLVDLYSRGPAVLSASKIVDLSRVD